MKTAAMNDQKKRSLPWPNGWVASGLRSERFREASSRSWLVVSATECAASAIIALEPLKAPPTPLATAIPAFAASAMYTVLWLSEAMAGRPTRPPTLRVVVPAPEKLLLATPPGYCAGVDRAVQTVERALELYGAPVYVRKEIVHNKHVVAQLRERGAVFVEELDDSIPEGATTVFSAHGVSPAVHAEATARHLFT